MPPKPLLASRSEPLIVPTSDWSPSLQTVGSLLRARTRDTNGTEVGTFSPDTRPTDDQATGLVVTATYDVAAAVGSEIPEALWPMAESVTSYRAAMLIELSYFPEQVAAGRSPYEQLKALYTESLKNLLARSTGDAPGGEPGAPSPPSYAFPVANTLDYVLGPAPGGYTVPLDGCSPSSTYLTWF